MHATRPARLSRAEARRLIGEIATDADRVLFHPHAAKRLVQRGISVTQVRQAIRTGAIVEGPYLDERDCWRVEIEGRAAGDPIHAALAILWPERLLVVTVFQPHRKGGR